MYSQEWENFKWLVDTSVTIFKHILTVVMILFMTALLAIVLGIAGTVTMHTIYPNKQGANYYETCDSRHTVCDRRR